MKWPFTRPRPKPEARLTLNYAPPDETGFMQYSPVQASRNATIHACVGMLASGVSQAKWTLLNSAGTPMGGTSGLYKLVKVPPWYWRVFTERFLFDGNAYMYRDDDGQMLPAVDGHPQLAYTVQGPQFYDLRLIDRRHFTRVPARKVLAIHGPGFDGIQSPSPIQHAAAAALNMEETAANQMVEDIKSGLRGRLGLETPVEMMNASAKQRANLAKDLRENFSGTAQRGQVPILPAGYKPVVLGGPSNVDLQIVELMKWTVEDLCRIFLTPPRMVGHYHAGMRTGTFEDSMADWVRVALTPLTELFAAEINRQVLPERATVRADVSELALGTLSNRVAAVNSAVAGAGVMTINEGRAILGLPPRPDGDKLLSPKGAPDQREGSDDEPQSEEPNNEEDDEDDET